MSRKGGAVIAIDNIVVSTGYNGPPRGVPHCNEIAFASFLKTAYHEDVSPVGAAQENTECPRRILGYKSGTHLELCPAVHAEENAIVAAARNGVSIRGATLYHNTEIPCRRCFGLAINAGIAEVVVKNDEFYDEMVRFYVANTRILVRKFFLYP
jgi:dCMP deaminase